MVFKFKVFDFWLIKNGFLIKMKKFCLDSAQKTAIVHMGQKESFWKWFRVNEETIFCIQGQKIFSYSHVWNLWERFYADVQKIPNFGSPVGIIGTPSFRKNWSLKTRNNGSAPKKGCISVCIQLGLGWLELKLLQLHHSFGTAQSLTPGLHAWTR